MAEKKLRSFTMSDADHRVLRFVAKKDGHTMSAEIALLVQWRIHMLRTRPDLSIEELIKLSKLEA